MKRIKTILVEDEPLALQSLQSLLKKYCPNVEVVAACGIMEDAMNEIIDKNPDLLILDIQLKEGTSFELLKQLPQLNFEIIFVTAFSQYAIKAIKFNALDYLLKPLDVDEVREAIARVENRISIRRPNKALQTFLENKSKLDINKRITLPVGDGMEFIEIKNIVFCKADGAYTAFHTLKRKILVSKNLKVFEEILKEYDFFRPHQSYLVNRAYILKYIKSDGGLLILQEGSNIPISKRRRKLFVDWING